MARSSFTPRLHIVLFILLQCTVNAAPSGLHPRLRCQNDNDCSEGHFMEGKCKSGVCGDVNDGKKCEFAKSIGVFCPIYRTCLNGVCVYGTTGMTCTPERFNCFLGFACDKATKKCVPGTEGTACTSQDECQFGHICYRGRRTVSGPRGMRGFANTTGICKKAVAFSEGCTVNRECGANATCKGTGLGITQCVPKFDFSKSVFPQGFGSCKVFSDCFYYNHQCDKGRCQPRTLGDPCSVQTGCGLFQNCIKSKCQYGTLGSPCYTQQFATRCLPGLVCQPNVADPTKKSGVSGTCVEGVEGKPCFDATECKDGLVCGTNGKCAKSAEGQKCLSSFWCPAGAVCVKSTQTCTFKHSTLNPNDISAENGRALSCKTLSDCRDQSQVCRNGVCTAADLGQKCEEASSCRTGASCVKGVCTEGVPGTVCANANQCATGYTCPQNKPGVKKCGRGVKGAFCLTFYNCETALTCDVTNSKCIVGTPGAPCKKDRQCPGGLLCLSGKCARPAGTIGEKSGSATPEASSLPETHESAVNPGSENPSRPGILPTNGPLLHHVSPTPTPTPVRPLLSNGTPSGATSAPKSADPSVSPEPCYVD